MCNKEDKDKKHGIVRFVNNMGGFFEGMYYDNRRQGFGREVFADGEYVTATFCRDIYDGEVTRYNGFGKVKNKAHYSMGLS